MLVTLLAVLEVRLTAEANVISEAACSPTIPEAASSFVDVPVMPPVAEFRKPRVSRVQEEAVREAFPVSPAFRSANVPDEF